jgi:predicted kinase
MKLTTSQSGSEVTIKFEGDLSGSLDNETREKVIELVQPGRLLIIDANDLQVCSGMTLRKLLPILSSADSTITFVAAQTLLVSRISSMKPLQP